MDVLRNIKTGGGTRQSTNIEYKCMNCRNIIEDPGQGLYGRRFCSEKCKEEYMRG